jgi:serine/threonine-protein kinase
MDAQELAAGVRPGDVLAGKYRIDRILGVGGMGVVVAAHHLQLDDPVAIKFLLPEALANADAVARFAREAQAAVRIKSEHVARVTDVGKLENGSPYMVMEYLEGVDLAARLQEQGRLPLEQAIEFVLQACEAIAEAHALGIVHRDLKPANLFVIRRPDGSPSVKVLDFGISKRTGLGASGPTMTRTSAVLGSPLYMSPEQMRSAKDVDTRSDIWALGTILYELLGGAPPFNAESLPELVLKVVSDAPASLRSIRPDVPEALERAIFTCLEKDRARRYESVGAFSAAIAPYGPSRAAISVERISRILQGAGIASSPFAQPAEAKSGSTMASWGQTASDAGRGRRVTLIAVASVLAFAMLGIGAYALSGRGAKADASAAPELPRAPVMASAPVVAPSATAANAPSTVVDVTPAAPPTTPAVKAASPAVNPQPDPVSAPALAKVRQKPRAPSASSVRTSSPTAPPAAPKPVPARDVYDDRK